MHRLDNVGNHSIHAGSRGCEIGFYAYFRTGSTSFNPIFLVGGARPNRPKARFGAALRQRRHIAAKRWRLLLQSA
jgi:hypothetical protein